MNTLIDRYYLLIQNPNASIEFFLRNESQSEALGKILGFKRAIKSAELFKSALDPLHPIRRAYRARLLGKPVTVTDWDKEFGNFLKRTQLVAA